MKDPRVDVILDYLASRDPRWATAVSDHVQELYNKVAELAAENHKDTPHVSEVDTKKVGVTEVTKKVLHQFGMPANLSGYKCCVVALGYCVNHPEVLHGNTTKVLYPYIGEVCNSSKTRVERSMRHAIEVAWDRCDMETITDLFGNSIDPNRGKPTNTEFLAMLSEKITMEVERYA